MWDVRRFGPGNNDESRQSAVEPPLPAAMIPRQLAFAQMSRSDAESLIAIVENTFGPTCCEMRMVRTSCRSSGSGQTPSPAWNWRLAEAPHANNAEWVRKLGDGQEEQREQPRPVI
jgi:hypothetical protein